MKKLILLLLCGVLVTGMFAGCGGEAPQEEAPGHSHCACGGELEGHSCESISYKPLTQGDFKNVTAETKPVSLHKETTFRLQGGNYYLSEDIVVSEQILIFEEVNLCLNEKRFAGTYSEVTGKFNRIFAVSGGTLNICDCCAQTEKGHIQGGYANQGGAILIQGKGGAAEGDLGTVNLYSGIIKGGKAQSTNGGTVSVTGGTLRVWEGQITGGAANKLGGNVYVDVGQNLELLGGSLTAGFANEGTCIYMASDATVTVGAKAWAEGVYLAEGAKLAVSEEHPLVETACIPVRMQAPGVFAENMETDLSAYFPGSVYDPQTKTLSMN